MGYLCLNHITYGLKLIGIDNVSIAAEYIDQTRTSSSDESDSSNNVKKTSETKYENERNNAVARAI